MKPDMETVAASRSSAFGVLPSRGGHEAEQRFVPPSVWVLMVTMTMIEAAATYFAIESRHRETPGPVAEQAWPHGPLVATPEPIGLAPRSSGQEMADADPALNNTAAFITLPKSKDCAGLSFPDQMQVDTESLSLNGLGLLTKFMVKVYVAALYVAETSNDPGAIPSSSGSTMVVLHYLRDVSANAMREYLDQLFERNAKGQLPALTERIAMLDSWMIDIKTNQRLTFVYTPGTGVQVDVNGVVKGTIEGDDFGKALLSIWLGDQANPAVKRGLLGGACWEREI